MAKNTVLKTTHERRVGELKAHIDNLEALAANKNYQIQRLESALSNSQDERAQLEKQLTRSNNIVNILEQDIGVAHRTLHDVNADENNTATIVRVIGNVQGLLFAALNRVATTKANPPKGYLACNLLPPLQVYQATEARRKNCRDKHIRNHMRRGNND